jgi:predicted nuclease with RNAse H fold
MHKLFLVIDFGARLSGKTVLAWAGAESLHLDRVMPGQDADRFLEETIAWLKPLAIYVDAPLSLPENYQVQAPEGDWFYRRADRQLEAMSPMFLGGLTARAIRLATLWRRRGIEVHETWPRGLVRELGLPGYRAKEPDGLALFGQTMKEAGFPAALPPVRDWHEVDALLAWWSGWRHENGQAAVHGDPAEGVIVC